MLPATAVLIRVPELPTDYSLQERGQGPAAVQRALLVLAHDFELVDPSDWHQLPVERLYPGLEHPSDFVGRPVQAVVAWLVRLLVQVLYPNLLAHWARLIQVCRTRA